MRICRHVAPRVFTLLLHARQLMYVSSVSVAICLPFFSDVRIRVLDMASEVADVSALHTAAAGAGAADLKVILKESLLEVLCENPALLSEASTSAEAAAPGESTVLTGQIHRGMHE